MAGQGESREQAPERLPAWWNETTLLAELAEHQGRLVFDTLTRAEQSRVVEAENARLAAELAGSLDRIQEVHHRVRNHLQAVTGLLSVEEIGADSEAARRALRESIARLTSIAAIHDLLARDPRSGQVCLGEMVERLSQHLLAQAGALGRVSVQARVMEVDLGSKQLTAVVLILTELLSNAIEHGFPEGREGQVEVEVAQVGAGARLVVRDDGRGLPAGLEVGVADSTFAPQTADCNAAPRLGLRLVARLAERDLKGRLSVAAREGQLGQGACFEIEFPLSAGAESG